MNSSQVCSYDDEVFSYSTGDPDVPMECWHIVIESCPNELPEEEGGGGSYEPDCNDWDCEPQDPTGGGGSYDPDDPNEAPTDTECTEDGNISQLPQDSDCNNEEACPPGQIDDGFGNCIDEEEKTGKVRLKFCEGLGTNL